MKRSPVKTTYRKVQRPRKRKRQIALHEVAPLRTPDGRFTPLGNYIEDNRDSGLPIHELIAQFQEYDCEHGFEAVGVTSTYTLYLCFECGAKKTKFKSGEKPND